MYKVKDMEIGQSAKISGYEKGDGQYRTRLLSMGLTRGTELTLKKVAPLGDPVEVEIRGFKLSLRKAESEILILEEVQ